jgi:hypothetical protein
MSPRLQWAPVLGVSPQYPESPVGYEICELLSKMKTMFHNVDIQNRPEDNDDEKR